MRRFLLLAAVTTCTAPEMGTAHASSLDRRPVVVELFSSEGCSSCPPADAFLRELVAQQPVPTAEVIALELHVDYWNQLGWSDPFSSATWSTRQRAYASQNGKNGVYTPQMIVDGDEEFVGSRADTAKTAIASAAKRTKAKVTLERHGSRVTTKIADLAEPDESEVWLAITESGLKTAVLRGENAGASLAHGPVVRRLDDLGAAKASLDAAIALDPDWIKENVRVVSFVQRRKDLHILGAGAISWK